MRGNPKIVSLSPLLAAAANPEENGRVPAARFDVRVYQPWTTRGEFCGIDRASIPETLDYIASDFGEGADDWAPATAHTHDTWRTKLADTDWTLEQAGYIEDEYPDAVSAARLLRTLDVGERLAFSPDVGSGPSYTIERVR